MLPSYALLVVGKINCAWSITATKYLLGSGYAWKFILHLKWEQIFDLGIKKNWRSNSGKCTHKCIFAHILKISGKYIEKCWRKSDLSEAHFWNINELYKYRRFCPFLAVFLTSYSHFSSYIKLEIDWEVYSKPAYHIKLSSLKNSNIWTNCRSKTIKFKNYNIQSQGQIAKTALGYIRHRIEVVTRAKRNRVLVNLRTTPTCHYLNPGLHK